MKPITIKVKRKLTFRIDMSFLSDEIKHSNLNQLKQLSIFYGKKIYKVKDLFQVSGDDVRNIHIESATHVMDNIGYRMKKMKIVVNGNAGYSFGQEMLSGYLRINGNTLDYAGSGLKGGSILIYGNTGDNLGGKPVGLNEGVSDGLIYVKGNVGNNCVQRMRRGNIIIEGNVGNDCCYKMISGTVIIKGKVGNNFCEGIKRGTIFTKDKSFAQNYTLANDVKINFVKFYLLQLKKYIGKNIFSQNIKLKRFYGQANKEDLSEVFLIS